MSQGVFQHHTSRRVAEFKQHEQVQELLRKGAVVEVLMEDILLGSRTLEEHLQLMDLWFAFGEAKDIYFKK